MLWKGNECGKNKSNEKFKTTITSKNYDRPKATRECGILKIFEYNGGYTSEIKYRIAMAKAAFSKKRALFTSILDLELRKKFVKCYI
jgi:hypothetical protein